MARNVNGKVIRICERKIPCMLGLPLNTPLKFGVAYGFGAGASLMPTVELPDVQVISFALDTDGDLVSTTIPRIGLAHLDFPIK